MFDRHFNCPRCGSENDESALECSNCGLKFVNITYEQYEYENFYFYNEKAYQDDLKKMGYDTSSRKINKKLFIALPLIFILILIVLAFFQLIPSWIAAVGVTIVIILVFLSTQIFSMKLPTPPEKILNEDDVNFCTNCRYLIMVNQDYCGYCLEKLDAIKFIILPELDLVFKKDKMRIYTKGTFNTRRVGDMLGNPLTGFFLEYELDKIYSIDFPLETESEEDKWVFKFMYDDEPVEHFWNYLTENRMLARYGKGWLNPNEIKDLDRGEWQFKISENAKYEIENIFSKN
jgi:hypothetical protein